MIHNIHTVSSSALQQELQQQPQELQLQQARAPPAAAAAAMAAAVAQQAPTCMLRNALVSPRFCMIACACDHAAFAASGLAFRYSMMPWACSAGMPGGIFTGTCQDA